MMTSLPPVALLNLYSLAKIPVLVKSNSAYSLSAPWKLNVAGERRLTTLTVVLLLESWPRTSGDLNARRSHYISLVHSLYRSLRHFFHLLACLPRYSVFLLFQLFALLSKINPFAPVLDPILSHLLKCIASAILPSLSCIYIFLSTGSCKLAHKDAVISPS